MAHQNAFFVIHCVDITRQIQSVNIYAVQYINHTWKGKESHPVCLFFLGFCSFKSKELPGGLGRILGLVRQMLFFRLKKKMQ